MAKRTRTKNQVPNRPPVLATRVSTSLSTSQSAVFTALALLAATFASPRAQAGSATQNFNFPTIFVNRNVPAPMNPELAAYESSRMRELPVKAPPDATYKRKHGLNVLARDAKGKATKIELTVLLDNPNAQAYVIGEFNNWGKALRPGDKLTPVQGSPELSSTIVDGLMSGAPYRILLDGVQVLDPAALMFTTEEYTRKTGKFSTEGNYLNSVFWDVRDPSNYQTKTDFVDTANRPNLIAEVELRSLISQFRTASGQIGPRDIADTYRFIAESGVIKKLKEAGYTAVEMLPFNQSSDGSNWQTRYLIYGLYAPDSRFGSPSDFKRMIDAFHQQAIAVVMDMVASHFPDDGNVNERSFKTSGLGQWKKADGRPLYAGEMSPWHTRRYDLANPFVRRSIVDSAAFMMNEYKIDGIRMDNVDGILSLSGGPEFLKELNTTARTLNPRALLIGEAFFAPDDLLRRLDKGGFGFNTKNDANFFEIWHKKLQGLTDDLSMYDIAERLKNAFDWLQVPNMRYLSNHDEAANDRGGLTGAYPAQLIEGDSWYAFGKIKAADSLNMLTGAYHLSFLQARMMQRGSFDKNPSVEWSMIEGGLGKNLWDFFGALGRYMQTRPSYFNFESLHREIENHIDDTNKIISLRRRDPQTGKEIYVLINLGHHALTDYRFGIQNEGTYGLAVDSERTEFGGRGAMQKLTQLHSESNGAHGKPNSLVVPTVAPYSVTVFEEQ